MMCNTTLEHNGEVIARRYHISRAIMRSVTICIFASCIAGLNVLFCRDALVANFIIFIELAILAYCFLRGNITIYFGCYLIFLCTSLEYGVFVGTEEFYSFKNFRILGVNLGLFLFFLSFLACFKGVKINKIKANYPSLYKYAYLCFSICSWNNIRFTSNIIK